ncbi:hypothetical protein FIBSPDRAFT_95578 [Athelia psychrophila]|uniref:Uncharacterized protein n=1 Tax=Athelia psychrophila TaxID=1759441 RepID=A0A166DS71_9AGAM|nr:hypothetical protein FIBSPDRAFT_95578 [Fibularhizoctonia sp. CBS 109695]
MRSLPCLLCARMSRGHNSYVPRLLNDLECDRGQEARERVCHNGTRSPGTLYLVARIVSPGSDHLICSPQSRICCLNATTEHFRSRTPYLLLVVAAAFSRKRRADIEFLFRFAPKSS